MTRRQILVLLSVPTFVAGLGTAALFTATPATGDPTLDASACNPGSRCCQSFDPAPAACATPAAAPGGECGSGPCCAPGCCGGAAGSGTR